MAICHEFVHPTMTTYEVTMYQLSSTRQKTVLITLIHTFKAASGQVKPFNGFLLPIERFQRLDSALNQLDRLCGQNILIV